MQNPYGERFEAIEHDLADVKQKIDNLESTFLESCQYLAEHDIEELRMYLARWISNNMEKSTAPYSKVHDFLVEESALAQQALKISPTPIKVARAFNNKCEKYFEKHHLRAFLYRD
jgi:hypothetical protein